MKLFSSALKHLSGVWQAAIADFRVQLYAKKVEVSAAFIELLRAYRLRYEAATHALGANSRDVALPRRVCCRRQCRTMRAALQTSASCATSSGSSLRTYPQASAGTPRRPWACPRRRTCATRLAWQSTTRWRSTARAARRGARHRSESERKERERREARA